jgi:hypothetical protein
MNMLPTVNVKMQCEIRRLEAPDGLKDECKTSVEVVAEWWMDGQAEEPSSELGWQATHAKPSLAQPLLMLPILLSNA